MTEAKGPLRDERRGPVAILTLDYPERRNALSLELRVRLLEAMRKVALDPEIRAVVLTGAGGHFSAGGDLSDMEVASYSAGRDRLAILHDLVRALIKGPKPVIAAIEGWCAGAGVSLALCCDIVVASSEARFLASFNKVGLVADLALLHTLPARVGQGAARRMLLECQQIDAEEALRIGLIDQAVPAGQTLESAVERARRFTDMAPLPVALTKEFLSRGLEEALAWEREVQAALFLTGDHAEGRAAFLEKRAPLFKGA
jgi:2-(1,2-epoxy-1,2-dihydrophenyl)acetyl-CoA isomerase